MGYRLGTQFKLLKTETLSGLGGSVKSEYAMIEASDHIEKSSAVFIFNRIFIILGL